MEYLLMGAALLAFAAAVFVLEGIRARKEEKRFIEKIRSEYLTLSEKKHSPDRLSKIPSFLKHHPEANQLDEITWNDCGMESVYHHMNYCLSAVGEEYLYYRLHTCNLTEDRADHFEKLVTYIEENPETRVKVQYAFSKMGYMGKYSLYDYIDNLDYLGVRNSMKHILADIALIVAVGLMFVQFQIGIAATVILTIRNIISYFKEKGEIDPYITSFAYILRMLSACDEIIKLKADGFSEEKKRMKSHAKALEGVRRGAFWVMLPSGKNNMSADPLTMILEYLRMVFHFDLLQFNKMLKEVRLHTDDVDALITLLGELETVVSVWIFRKSLVNGWCVPEKCEEKQINMEQGYHPLLDSPVKNSILAEKNVLLTGSNASGKSTFLKTVAVNAILAQTVHTCAAERFAAPSFRVYSSMALHDDLSGGDSYYIVEIKALKRILDAAENEGEPVLCFVDEVLRGTNTVERIAASSQILESLNSNVLCFAATHDIELTSILEHCFDNYHFEENIGNGDIEFNYRLLTGKANTRNAIRLLELLGYSPDIVAKARSKAEGFLENGVWL